MSENIKNQNSEEELYKKYEAMGFSGDDLELMVRTASTVETLDMLPDDVAGFVEKLDKDLPDDISGTVKTMLEMTEKDPEYAKQIFAFASLLDQNMNKAPQTSVGKISAEDIAAAKADMDN